MSNEQQVKSEIAEILGLLEKLGKDKYLVLEQIRKQNVQVAVNPTMSTYEILLKCPTSFVSSLLKFLNDADAGGDDSPGYTMTYHWFFTDIVASSDPSIAVDDQSRKIIALNKIIQKTNTFRNRRPESTIILPTGDGNAIGFGDSPEKPLLLAIELHGAINEYNTKNPKNRIDLRVGLDTGSVYAVKDLLGNNNVWGPGIVYARRVMDLGREKSILASARFANEVQRLKPEFKKIMHLIGNYPIKHGESIPIYNIYGNIYGIEIGTKKNPIARRTQKSAAVSEIGKIVNTFLFNKIEVFLNIVDKQTMMTHHTLVWHMINQSDKPVDKVFYNLDGDTPRDFPDLNVKITDEEGKELQVESLNLNMPYKKEFFAKLDKPFKPNQKGRFVKLEYDWEEPERQFLYRFASDCKKFQYLLTAPKGMTISQKVVRVFPDTGDKMVASTPAVVRYLGDRTEVEWTANNLPAFDAYRFDW